MPDKILIVRFSSIGDIVLTTPVIRCVKEQTGAEVHFLTKGKFAGILQHNPHLNKVWSIDKKLSEVSTQLRRVGFDYVLDLHNNLRTMELAWHLRKSKFYRFNKLNVNKWLLTRWKINRLPGIHIVDRYLATAQPLGVVNDRKGLEYHLGKGDFKVAESFSTSQPYVAFVIGAAHATKCLTEEQKIAFCQQYPDRILLLGGPAEEEEGARIAAASGNHVVNTCGQLKLNESAYLVSKAMAVLTHDTGLMHIAAAFRKPIISIWGNTVPDFGMYPYLPGAEQVEKNRRLEVTGLSCRPCSKIGFSACPQGHFRCVKDIAVVDMLEKVREL
ncbi:MAG: glycosyltransferase family 9 protein [Bacteroidota bacterium]